MHAGSHACLSGSREENGWERGDFAQLSGPKKQLTAEGLRQAAFLPNIRISDEVGCPLFV